MGYSATGSMHPHCLLGNHESMLMYFFGSRQHHLSSCTRRGIGLYWRPQTRQRAHPETSPNTSSTVAIPVGMAQLSALAASSANICQTCFLEMLYRAHTNRLRVHAHCCKEANM